MSLGFSGDLSHDAPLIVKKPIHDEARFDITAMIDLVFMMNIFFLVTSIFTSLAEIDLPKAKHVMPADLDQAVVVTMVPGGSDGSLLFIADGTKGEPIADPVQQEKRVREAVEASVAAGKKQLVIKADSQVLHRDVSRVAAAGT